MDTTFWGPSGHQLLHSLTYRFDELSLVDRELMAPALIKFFESVGHLLPCIYCRRSYQKYFKELQLRDFIGKSVFEWYYKIHNLINDKLRKQGYLDKPDPSLRSVRAHYARESVKTCFVGWDFLYSVVYHYPTHFTELSRRRLQAYALFFNALALFYPDPAIRAKYVKYLHSHPIESALVGSRSLIKWMYGFEKRINPRCCSLRRRCDRLEKYKVKKCANKSCRKSSRPKTRVKS